MHDQGILFKQKTGIPGSGANKYRNPAGLGLAQDQHVDLCYKEM